MQYAYDFSQARDTMESFYNVRGWKGLIAPARPTRCCGGSGIGGQGLGGFVDHRARLGEAPGSPNFPSC